MRSRTLTEDQQKCPGHDAGDQSQHSSQAARFDARNCSHHRWHGYGTGYQVRWSDYVCGDMASKYYTIITAPLSHNNCSEVHMAFDQYWGSSIKGGERARRGSSSALEVQINSPFTPVPKQWTKYIANPQNKVNLCDFLTGCTMQTWPTKDPGKQETRNWWRLQRW